jgi:1,4-dihydroxy-2-naphthoate octaprenyltransferase
MKSIIQHLRFPFSALLMPVFLFSAWYIESDHFNSWNFWLLFFILHVLVYPSSNAYNSTQDRDEGSVGLIAKPLPISSHLIGITAILDLIAMVLSLFINWQTAILIFLYILASRLYSWRKIRLKQYPFIGFLTVFICQGALVFYMVQFSQNDHMNLLDFSISIPHALNASLFIGSMYPLSQIYQHEQDRKDGVRTISAMLGYRNTFLFAGLQFVLASMLLTFSLFKAGDMNSLLIFGVSQLPVIVYFLYWFYNVMMDNANANFKHTMYMNIISAVCMNGCFMILICNKL